MAEQSRRSTTVVTERTGMSISDFESEIIRLDGASECTNILVYGASNAGKTVLAGTAPGKVFWLIGEPGYKSAARQGAKGHGRKIGSTAAALAAVDWLEHKNRYERYNWIVLDGLSNMEKRFRLGYAQEAYDLKGSRTHRNLPDKPDYFNTQNFLISWIPRLVDMPVNLLITAHAYSTEARDGELWVFPGVQGKGTETANAIAGLMDITAFYQKKRIYSRDGKRSKVLRRLWFDAPERGKDEEEVNYLVGDKLDCLGSYMDFPTIPKIMAKINGESEEASDEG